MKTLIDGYRSFPGDHCGSVAMRGLLNHYCGLDLPESAVFGLGAGLDCMYIRGPGMDPARTVFGRTGMMELNAAAALGIDYREQREPDDADAWRIVREEVMAGRPTMLTGDILYLDYREFKVHFPSHRFVLVGFDDATQKAFIADRIREEYEACSYGALATSRNPPEGLSTQNLWGRFHDTAVGSSLADAARTAIAKCSGQMLESLDSTETDESADSLMSGLDGENKISTGIAAIRDLAHEMPGWAERDDAAWIASFNARCIEKFGNGGGQFRRLYAGFLNWARTLSPDLVPEAAPGLCVQAADAWTATAAELALAADEGADPAAFSRAAEHARRAANIEEDLFRRLADQAA
jgi:hypothetical protein